jgi:hypothetical protein
MTNEVVLEANQQTLFSILRDKPKTTRRRNQPAASNLLLDQHIHGEPADLLRDGLSSPVGNLNHASEDPIQQDERSLRSPDQSNHAIGVDGAGQHAQSHSQSTTEEPEIDHLTTPLRGSAWISYVPNPADLEASKQGSPKPVSHGSPRHFSVDTNVAPLTRGDSSASINSSLHQGPPQSEQAYPTQQEDSHADAGLNTESKTVRKSKRQLPVDQLILLPPVDDDDDDDMFVRVS